LHDRSRTAEQTAPTSLPPAPEVSDTPRSKNVAAPDNDNVTSRNPESVHHCGRTILYAFFQRIEDMLIGSVLFVAFVVATGAAIVKAFEWHQDVLYGPYLKRQD